MFGSRATTKEEARERDPWVPPWLKEVRLDLPEAPEPPRPDRYRVKRSDDGAFLVCLEAPTVKVAIRPGVTVTAAAVRSAAPGAIFLDGAAQGEPFLDPKRAVYNLDHHEGCVRAFTMATCEQAMVLLRKGLNLRKRDWTVYANDADLDTILAIWLLLNHIRLEESEEARTRVMPLVRLQGTIDAQGLELQDLCAFPPDLLAETQAWIAALREREIAIKAQDGWRELDQLDYAADVLHAVDHLIYPARQLADLAEIEELARVDIANGSVAIVCRSQAGIYEVERQLRRLHGERLGVVALQKDAATYSLRQVDPYLPATLESVYAHLNLVDSAAGGSRSSNRWGGSAEIGGSPRGTGTRVTPEQIAVVCQLAFGTPTLLERVRRVAGAAVRNAGVMVAALAWVFFLFTVGNQIGVPGEAVPDPAAEFTVLLAIIGGGLFCWKGLRTRGLYGFRRPVGAGWWWLLPVALGGAMMGGVWLPQVALPHPAHPFPGWTALVAIAVLPVAAEVIFRGLFLGSLLTTFPMHTRRARWILSWPVFLSGALYSLWGTILQHPIMGLVHPLPSPTDAMVTHLGALVFGVAAGMARERSDSVVAAILFHWVSVAVVLAAGWLPAGFVAQILH
jgi:hypothetical protein